MGATSKRLKRKLMNPVRVYTSGLPKTCGSLFLDSGAHSLYNNEVTYKKHAFGYDWYDGPEFRAYLDEYAAFLKAHLDVLDFYANVDVIFSPERSWAAQKYLEQEHGLTPVPVIHFGTPLKWIEKHLDAGYKFLGVGGLGQEAPKASYIPWANRLFEYLCPPPRRVPVVRTHGFAMTSFDLMSRFPWASVDSSSWAKAAGFGTIIVPPRRDGRFVFGCTEDTRPRMIALSHRSEMRKVKGKHYDSISPTWRADLHAWLDEIGVPVGTMTPDPTGKLEELPKGNRLLQQAPGPEMMSDEFGVFSQYNARALANLRYFDRFCKALPPWPRTFTPPTARRGLGLGRGDDEVPPLTAARVPRYKPSKGLRLYFSGGSAICETGLKAPAIMPSYFVTVHKSGKADARLRGLLAARKATKEGKVHL